MILTKSNLQVFKHEKGYTLKLLMPDNSDNYLHLQLYNDIESVLLYRDVLLDQEIDSLQLVIKEDETYYRLWLYLRDDNDDRYPFHSRKLNLNDAIHERDMMLE